MMNIIELLKKYILNIKYYTLKLIFFKYFNYVDRYSYKILENNFSKMKWL